MVAMNHPRAIFRFGCVGYPRRASPLTYSATLKPLPASFSFLSRGSSFAGNAPSRDQLDDSLAAWDDDFLASLVTG